MYSHFLSNFTTSSIFRRFFALAIRFEIAFQNPNVVLCYIHYLVTLLSIQNLKVRYQTQGKQVHAVDDVSFSLEANESIGIAGESACGKSTLGLALMRALQANATVSGEILLDDKSILNMPDEEFTKTLRWKKI